PKREAVPMPERPGAAGAGVTAAAAARRAPAGRGAPRTPFVLLVVGLLCGGLVSLLLLNTVLAKDSFRATDLQKTTQRLRQEAQDKRTKLLLDSQPQRLADRVEQLGEKPGTQEPRFLDGQGREVGRTASQGRVPEGAADRQAEVAGR
ncbi:hypothetical protein ACFQSB_40230, partial [Sphaerisporangium rhizosphaerae]